MLSADLSVGCLASLCLLAEGIEGCPTSLGFLSPEATAPGHPQCPSDPLGRHKNDVYAVGVMGLFFLSTKAEMPFGPTEEQMERVQRDPTALQEVKEKVMSNHKAWVSHVRMSCLICAFARVNGTWTARVNSYSKANYQGGQSGLSVNVTQHVFEERWH